MARGIWTAGMRGLPASWQPERLCIGGGIQGEGGIGRDEAREDAGRDAQHLMFTYDVHPNLITQRRAKLLETAADVFGAEQAPPEPAVDVKVLHGAGEPIHQHRLHRGLQTRGERDQHGQKRLLARQRVRGERRYLIWNSVTSSDDEQSVCSATILNMISGLNDVFRVRSCTFPPPRLCCSS